MSNITPYIVCIYILILITLFFIDRKMSLLFFFGTKFTFDLLWPYTFIKNVTYLQLVGIVLLLLFVFLYVKDKPVFDKRSTIFQIIIVLTILNLIAGVWGYLNNRYHFFQLAASPLSLFHIMEWTGKWLLQLGAFLLVPTIFSTKNDVRKLLLAIVISTLIPNILGIFQIAENIYILWNFDSNQLYSVGIFPRINSNYHESTTLAFVMFIGVVSSFALFSLEKRSTQKHLLAGNIFFHSFVIYFTFSRTMWITTIIFFLLVFLMSKRYLVFSLLVIGAICLFMFVPSTQKRFQRELSFFLDPHSAMNDYEKLGTGRIALWKEAQAHVAKLDPISKIIGSGGAYGSHNQYIAQFLKNGFVGLSFFFLFLFYIGKVLYRNSLIYYKFYWFSFYIVVLFIANVFAQPWENSTFSLCFWSLIGIAIQQNEKNYNH